MSRDQAKPTARNGKAAPVPNPTLDALAAGKAVGRVKFDDRGNAVLELSAPAHPASAHPAPVSADHTGRGRGVPRANNSRTLHGYDPYESGEPKHSKSKTVPKKDLRKLGEWMKLRQQASKNRQEP